MRVSAVAAIALLLGQLVHAEEEPVINVYNWADYVADSTIANFEVEFGIKVNYDIYDSSEMVDVKLMAGGSGYDVVMHAASFSARLIPVGIYQKLDKAKLSNWHHLDPDLLDMFRIFDPSADYGVPYMWGSTGFTYNVDMIKERMADAPLASADMIFKPEIISRFADCGVSFLDSPIDVIPLALLYLGYDSNSVAADELKAAENLVKAVRPYVKYFSSTKLLIDLPNSEVCIAMSWSGDYAQAAHRAEQAGINIDLAYTMPKEGSPAWFDALFIPSDAPHPDNAHLFLDYLLRPEVIAEISDAIHYANANATATALVDPQIVADPAVYPNAEMRKLLFPAKVLPPKVERLRTRVWTRMKTGL